MSRGSLRPRPLLGWMRHRTADILEEIIRHCALSSSLSTTCTVQAYNKECPPAIEDRATRRQRPPELPCEGLVSDGSQGSVVLIPKPAPLAVQNEDFQATFRGLPDFKNTRVMLHRIGLVKSFPNSGLKIITRYYFGR